MEQRWMEHRWGQRIALSLAVQLFISPNRVVAAHMRDVSISGCRVELVEPCAALHGIELDVDIAPFSAVYEGLRLQGCIVRRTDQGFGVEWNELAPPGLASILEWASHPCADSGLVICAVA